MATLLPPTILPPPKPDHESTKPPPKNASTRMFLWRWRMWFESTFALSMLEPWEKALLLTILGVLCLFVTSGLFKYLPQHLQFLQRRAEYYMWGEEQDHKILWQWLGSARGNAAEGVKRLMNANEL